MSIKSVLGLESDKKVRYGFVALGDIAQEAMLPGVAHTGNSEISAFVTADPEKARLVGKRYNVSDSYTYEQFDELLHSGKVDAIYLSTPNDRHAEFAVPALKAGIHVLVEKPLEVSTARCQEILDAQKTTSAKLMVAYRLHFEPATLDLIRKIRAGELGHVHLFSSTFSQMVSPDNHRAKNGIASGALLDMAPYPINASRYVFDDEPTAVISAVGTRHPESGLGDFDHTVAVTLEFPGARLAQFIVSYFASSTNAFFAIGTEGNVLMNPSYLYGNPLEQRLTTADGQDHESFKNTDHFGGELAYFSDCILNDRDPEPNGEEGYADVRVIEGILESLKTGGRVELPPFARSRRIDPEAQERKFGARKPPDLVHASNPGKGVDKMAKN